LNLHVVDEQPNDVSLEEDALFFFLHVGSLEHHVESLEHHVEPPPQDVGSLEPLVESPDPHHGFLGNTCESPFAWNL